MLNELGDERRAFPADNGLLCRATAMEFVSMQNIVDNQKKINSVTRYFSCCHCRLLVHDDGFGH